MTETEIQCLKQNVGKFVEIETSDGELLVAKLIDVFDDSALDEHELFCEVVSSNVREPAVEADAAEGYALDFDDILSATPHDAVNR